MPKNVGLLESARDLDGVVRFPHDLARQAVPDLMTEYQRATENARVAKVLEEQFPAVDLRVQRLAHHYANAQALGYADKAVLYLARAAGAAEVGLAHHEAARLLERAAGIANDAGQWDELRLQAARSCLRASMFSRARELNELIASTTRGPERLRAAVDRRIAERLVISENTAAGHVRNILMKTGAWNRTQAAMYAATHGLLEQHPADSRSGGSARHRVKCSVGKDPIGNLDDDVGR